MRGYSLLAWRASEHPALAIVRRFKALHMQNLLYLQAELSHLETAFREEAEKNENSTDERERWFSRDWRHLEACDPSTKEQSREWELFLEIREKLKEFGTAISEIFSKFALTLLHR